MFVIEITIARALTNVLKKESFFAGIETLAYSRLMGVRGHAQRTGFGVSFDYHI
jgi:hypothetical protein